MLSVKTAQNAQFSNQDFYDINDVLLIDTKDIEAMEQSHKDLCPITVELLTESEQKDWDAQWAQLIANDPSLDIDVNDIHCLRFAHSPAPSYEVKGHGTNAFWLPLAYDSAFKDMNAPLSKPICHVKVALDFGQYKCAHISPESARKCVYFHGKDLAKCVKGHAYAVAKAFDRLPVDAFDAGVWFERQGWGRLAECIDDIVEDITHEFGDVWVSIERLEYMARIYRVSVIKELTFLLEVTKAIKL